MKRLIVLVDVSKSFFANVRKVGDDMKIVKGEMVDARRGWGRSVGGRSVFTRCTCAIQEAAIPAQNKKKTHESDRRYSERLD